jgi:ComF family protein
MQLLDTAITALLPARCPGCGRSAEPVCDACAAAMRAAPRLAIPSGLDAWVAPFAYEGVARELVARMKYRNQRAALPWLADAMAATLVSRAAVPPDAVVTWAPASGPRRRARGFDHGELLARGVADRLARPVAGLLVRAPGPAQTGLARAERRPGPSLTTTSAATRIRAVVVVDDVLTTGATLTAAAAALRRAGVGRVLAVTAAATPPPGARPNGRVAAGPARAGTEASRRAEPAGPTGQQRARASPLPILRA